MRISLVWILCGLLAGVSTAAVAQRMAQTNASGSQAQPDDAADEVGDDADGAPDEKEIAAEAAEEADDAIPTDRVADPTLEEWDVVKFEDDGDNEEDAPRPTNNGIGEPSDIPTVRRPTHRKKDTAPGQDFARSAGGRPVPDKGVPWQAQIYGPFAMERFDAKKREGKALWMMQHYCGGSLISHDWVLTAAHCIDQDMVNVGYRVRLGAEDISRDDGITFKIDRIVRHENYAEVERPEQPNMYVNDIALVHIVDDGSARKRDPTQIREIALYKGPAPADGTEVTGTGWGKTEAVDGVAPHAVLLKVDLKVMAEDKCRNLPGYGPAKIHDKVLCAGNPQRSTCQGDSGGPVIFTNGAPVLVGVISWGKKRCTGDGQPGVYTSVAQYRDWISKAMLLDPKQNSLP